MKNTLNIGICGLGTVGSGVFALLVANSKLLSMRTNCAFNLVQVASRNIPTDLNLQNVAVSNDIFAVANNPNINVVVELIGGINPALELVLTAINNGKHVVTANKALLALHGEQIFSLAQEKGVTVAFEASVAGGIPIIKVLRESLAADQINLIAGIINGTSNFILTSMHQHKRDFADVLLEAQSLGYAEADPTFDIAGIDAAHKLTLLASIAFGINLQFAKVYCEGIASITSYDIEHALSLGYSIKHLGIARRTSSGIELRVHPTLIAEHQILAKVDGVMNAVLVNSKALGTSLYYGKGAGASPTASAIVADIVDLARANTCVPFLGNHKLSDLPILSIEDSISAYYLRMMVKDVPGVLAQITQIFSKFNINIETIIQQENEVSKGNVPIVIVTHLVQENIINQAIIELEKQANIVNKINKIRILDC